MKPFRLITLLLVLAVPSLESGCKPHARSPDAAVEFLKGDDAGMRRRGADDLRRFLRDDTAIDVVAPLAEAAYRESNNEALGSILLALAATGAPEARLIIEQFLESPSLHVKRSARRAREIWSARSVWRSRGAGDSGARAP